MELLKAILRDLVTGVLSPRDVVYGKPKPPPKEDKT